MTRRKLKPFVLPTLYSLAVVIFILCMFLVQSILNNSLLEANELKDDIEYVDGDITDNIDKDIPVVATKIIINKPYIDSSVKVVKNYYDYLSSSEEQEKSIVYYENTYMQNSGIDLSSGNVFDVVSILDGEVISVKEDELLGKIVEIRHENELISVYQSLSEINVKENDNVLANQVIGKSGESNVNKDLGNHLHFELYHHGKVVNPINYFDKNVDELN